MHELYMFHLGNGHIPAFLCVHGVYKGNQKNAMSVSAAKTKWSDQQLQAALQAVEAGQLKPHRAAVKFGIPPSTLYDHLKGKSTKRYGGLPTILTHAEKEIATACGVLQQFGYSLTTDIVGVIVRDYVLAAQSCHCFVPPGKGNFIRLSYDPMN